MPAWVSSRLDNLLPWYDANKRGLPWRGSRNPYAIWVSEIMLQQTQVATVIPYFLRWIERFPTVHTLAAASEQDVLALWQGLGYYRRCRMLLKGAQFILSEGMPRTAQEWQTVPGVGRYTAGAIASIANGEVTPLVDGNVERVFARLTGSDLCGQKLTSSAWQWAERTIDRTRPGDHNQALMELGATICKPQIPACASCPLKAQCIAFATSSQGSLPVKTKPRQTVALRQCVTVHYSQGRFGLRQIPDGEWWQGMWEFPRSDGDKARPTGRNLGTIRHAVTHHKITLDVFLVKDGNPTLTWYSQDELANLPLPSPQRRVLKIALAHLRAFEQAAKTSAATA